MIKKYYEKLNDEQKRVRGEIREKTASYILGAFGLVAALAWNDAVKALIEFTFPQGKNGNTVVLKFLYASIITVVVVVITMYLIRLLRRNDGDDINIKK